MKRFILITISVAFAIAFFNQCGSSKKAEIGKNAQPQESLLAAYGEQLYKRESCAKCHTLQVKQESSELFSLDGVGGRYPNFWLYNYLLEPSSMNPDSKKPSNYERLNGPLEKKVLLTIDKSDGAWEKLLKEAATLESELNGYGAMNGETEVLALIAYIQQIPASKEMAKLVKIAQEENNNFQKERDKIFADSLDMIVAIAEDTANIEKGRYLFRTTCSPCHGSEGQGIVGPNLTDDYWLHGGKKSDIAQTIINGVPEKGMLSWKTLLSPKEVGEIVSFIASIKGSNPENAKGPQGKKE